MKRSFLFFMIIALATSTNAQTGNNPGFGKTGAQDICEQLSFSNDEEVNNLVNKILDYAGVENRNYEIRGCSGVSSCYATVKNNQQYIVYQPDYLKDIKSYGFTNTSLPAADKDWQALTILAHEVGHLINTHFFNCKENITPWNKELQADEFAGRIIYELNGTLEQAKSVYNSSIVSIDGSMSHPPRADRLTAVTKGYRKAEDLYKRHSNNKAVEPAPVVKPAEHPVPAPVKNDSDPTSFTPNGDGNNDYFFPRQFLTAEVASFRMEIYNRWGKEIFSTTSLSGPGWDGRDNGALQPAGAYYFNIDAVLKDGQKKHHTGSVTLIK